MTKKIVYYTGCFADYYGPDIGKSFVEVMEKNGFEVIVPDTKCCGMPQMANSNLQGARRNFEFNTRVLAKAAAPGYDILSTCPSCNMMLRREGLPFFDSEGARFVASRVYDACEYLLRLHGEGKLNTDFGSMPIRVFYHNPCHLRVQNLTPAVDLMKLIPDLEVVKVNLNCCGMGGSYGMKRQNYDRSKEIAQKIWDEVKAANVDVVATDCGGCGLQVQAGTGAKIMHPLTVLNQAYKAFKAREAA
ncbi:MAG: Anaerobic glycerol-3-phosphate dehydrogenase subunit C [Syntrophorhabdus sp. PtaU1.Bin153]|nr:MAG: Anaerobic glycerol-3-phosphate dehydrogenase subunit C [Syntrophorhabdus sp. PtaU1.Bin153]